MYEYQAIVTAVIDGDTVHADVDLGMRVHFKTILRLYGINSPELSTDAGKVAKQFTIDWLAANTLANTVRIRTYKDKTEKYGRYLADIYKLDGTGDSLNIALVESNNAVVYMV
jgi:micrococcal nuclease